MLVINSTKFNFATLQCKDEPGFQLSLLLTRDKTCVTPPP